MLAHVTGLEPVTSLLEGEPSFFGPTFKGEG